MGDARFDAAYDEITPREALEVLEHFYSSSMDDAAEWARNHERAGYEKWSPNPLPTRPWSLFQTVAVSCPGLGR